MVSTNRSTVGSMIGSREKLEEYRKQSITQMRQQMHDDFKNQQLIQKMKQELVKDIKVSPAQVRKYFKDLPADSIPFVPTEVEVEILTMQPRIPLEEINRVKISCVSLLTCDNGGDLLCYFGSSLF